MNTKLIPRHQVSAYRQPFQWYMFRINGVDGESNQQEAILQTILMRQVIILPLVKKRRLLLTLPQWMMLWLILVLKIIKILLSNAKNSSNALHG